MTTDTATTTDTQAVTDTAKGTATTAEQTATDAAKGGEVTGPKAPETDLTKRTAKDDAGKEWTAEEALAEVRRLRGEDARKRVERKGLPDALKVLAAAAGIELPDEAPTVESLGKDLQAKDVDLTRATERASKAETDLAIIRAAWAAGIDPAREKYLAFTLAEDAEVASKRGTDEFGATVSAKITSLAGSDPMLKGNAGSGGKASGPDSFGGANGTSAITQEQFEAMEYDARLALFEKNPEEYRRLSAG